MNDYDLKNKKAMNVETIKMNKEENKKRKHGTVQRLFAAMGVFAIFITSILTLIFGLSGFFVAIYVAALASITGPAFTEGADGF